jgi:hypothetical protein
VALSYSAFEERVYDELAPPHVLAARIEARAAYSQ